MQTCLPMWPHSKEAFRRILDVQWHISSFARAYSTRRKELDCLCVLLSMTGSHLTVGGSVASLIKVCGKIDHTSLLLIIALYNVKKCGLTSNSISILQVTRQGGQSSAQCYLMFINKLFYILSISGLGVCINNCYTSCPTVADDMILMAFSRKALKIMIYICYNYSCKWRFEYNSSKCAVIVFNKQR